MDPRIDVGTIGGLHERQHELLSYCPHRDRWTQPDLVAIVDAGQDNRRLPIKVRCRDCGELGRVQVRLPAKKMSPSS